LTGHPRHGRILYEQISNRFSESGPVFVARGCLPRAALFVFLPVPLSVHKIDGCVKIKDIFNGLV